MNYVIFSLIQSLSTEGAYCLILPADWLECLFQMSRIEFNGLTRCWSFQIMFDLEGVVIIQLTIIYSCHVCVDVLHPETSVYR